jgi:hypothetical protein
LIVFGSISWSNRIVNVITGIADPIIIAVFLARVEIVNTVITFITDAVIVSVSLIQVADKRAIIALGAKSVIIWDPPDPD